MDMSTPCWSARGRYTAGDRPKTLNEVNTSIQQTITRSCCRDLGDRLFSFGMVKYVIRVQGIVSLQPQVHSSCASLFSCLRARLLGQPRKFFLWLTKKVACARILLGQRLNQNSGVIHGGIQYPAYFPGVILTPILEIRKYICLKISCLCQHLPRRVKIHNFTSFPGVTFTPA